MNKIREMKVFKVFILMILTVLMSYMVPVQVFAEDLDTPVTEIPILESYYDPSAWTFSGSYYDGIRYYVGNYMGLEAQATSTAGSIPVYIDILIYSTGNHYGRVVWTNNHLHKFDYLYLGSSGGSASSNYYFVDDAYSSETITMDIRTYSWTE